MSIRFDLEVHVGAQRNDHPARQPRVQGDPIRGPPDQRRRAPPSGEPGGSRDQRDGVDADIGAGVQTSTMALLPM